MLSPSRAQTGKNDRSAISRRVAKARNSSRMASYTPWSQSTRSILFTHTATWGTRNRVARNACRRDCSNSPFRASTSTNATSAVEAPVTMLRVYCTAPGESARMNLRRAVVKYR